MTELHPVDAAALVALLTLAALCWAWGRER